MVSVDEYNPINWKDAPEHQTTPLNSMNLGHMDEGIMKNNQAIQALCTEVSSKAANNPTFTQASSLANIESGESTPTLFGKIKKWLASLGNLAFLSKNNSTSQYLRGDGTWATPPNTTYGNATPSAAGLMSASDKSKLNGIASGAQVNSVTGVKGNSESSYRTGNVNITKANIGLGNVDNTADANKSVSYASSAGHATSAGTAVSATSWAGNPGFTASGGNPKFNSDNLVTGPTDNTMQILWKKYGEYGPHLKVGNNDVGNLVRGDTNHNMSLHWDGSHCYLYVDGSQIGMIV